VPTEFIAQIPFFRAVEFQPIELRDLWVERVLEAVTGLSGQLAFPIDGYGSFYPEFTIHNKWPRDEPELAVDWQPYAVLTIKFATEIPHDVPLNWHDPHNCHCSQKDVILSEGQVNFLQRSVIASGLRERALDLVTVLGLASPGKFRAKSGEIFFNGHLDNEIPAFDPPLDIAVETAAEYEWPRLSDQPIEEMWR
jgi:hypothetical protein